MFKWQTLRFRSKKTLSVGFVLLFSLFLALGIWQLRRADEKKALLVLQERNNVAAPLDISRLDPLPEQDRYRPLIAGGRYDAAHQFLLDNQIFKGQAGYYVLTPLRLSDSGKAVLVNRGWLPIGGNRQQLPELPLGENDVRITGLLDRLPRLGFKLKGAEIPGPGWPSVLQMADVDKLSARLGYRLEPYQVLLDGDEQNGYERAWRAVTLKPETNQAYALQWFSFALTLAGVYLWYGFKPKPDGYR